MFQSNINKHSFGLDSKNNYALIINICLHSKLLTCILGKSMKDYDEGFKEMKKENFNLKLRIFFLEERLGLGKKTNAQDLANANLELKVTI